MDRWNIVCGIRKGEVLIVRGGICTNILHKSPVGTILVQILAAHNRWKT